MKSAFVILGAFVGGFLVGGMMTKSGSGCCRIVSEELHDKLGGRFDFLSGNAGAIVSDKLTNLLNGIL